MTKLRAPLSTEQAINRIVGVIGWDGAAAALGLTESAVRKKGDPDATGCLSFDEALQLDLAYKAAGGDGAPLLESYAHRLEIAFADASANAVDLIRIAGAVAKESGEAVQAIALAALPGAGPHEREHARREAVEGIDVLSAALAKLGKGPSDALHCPGGQP